jgi:hypothetical protein
VASGFVGSRLCPAVAKTSQPRRDNTPYGCYDAPGTDFVTGQRIGVDGGRSLGS